MSTQNESTNVRIILVTNRIFVSSLSRRTNLEQTFQTPITNGRVPGVTTIAAMMMMMMTMMSSTTTIEDVRVLVKRIWQRVWMIRSMADAYFVCHLVS